jgi:hypothetical protein
MSMPFAARLWPSKTSGWGNASDGVHTTPLADAKIGLEKTMIEGMAAVINGRDEVDVPVEVEAR